MCNECQIVDVVVDVRRCFWYGFVGQIYGPAAQLCPQDALRNTTPDLNSFPQFLDLLQSRWITAIRFKAQAVRPTPPLENPQLSRF